MNKFEEVKQRISLLDYARRVLNLQKIGEKYRALCPFHAEKTASFYIDAHKNLFHCFGCQAGGDLFAFYSKYNNCDIKTALQQLASQVGVILYEERKNDLDQLCEFFEQHQFSEFFTQRGVELSSVKKFKLGWAPSFEQTKKFIQKKELHLEKFGFKENFWKFFENRVVFPIYNFQNKLISFAGRTLLQDKAKYVNGPASFLFNKSEVLYGENLVKKGQPLYIVEGYLDVILMHQHGFNAIASMGTSFTQTHLTKIFEWTSEICIAMDADKAGQNSAFKIAMLVLKNLKPGQTVEFLFFPTGHDPASYLKEFKKLEDLKKLTLHEYLFSFKDYMETPEKKASFFQKLITWANEIQDNVLRFEYKKEWQKLWWKKKNEMKLNYASLEKEYLECLLFKYLLEHPKLVQLMPDLINLPLSKKYKNFLIQLINNENLDEFMLKKINAIELFENFANFEEVLEKFKNLLTYFKSLFDRDSKINEFVAHFSQGEWEKFQNYLKEKEEDV